MRFCTFKMLIKSNRKVVGKKSSTARAQENVTMKKNASEPLGERQCDKRVELAIDINSLEEYRSPSNKSIRLCRDKRSFLDNDGYWNVYPVAFNKAQVYVVCPHCGEIHLHGKGQEPDFKYEGHRACQCLNCINNGYVILRGNNA